MQTSFLGSCCLFRHSHVTTQIMAAWKTSNILIVQRIANLTPRRRKIVSGDAQQPPCSVYFLVFTLGRILPSNIGAYARSSLVVVTIPMGSPFDVLFSLLYSLRHL